MTEFGFRTGLGADLQFLKVRAAERLDGSLDFVRRHGQLCQHCAG